jgi:hypothetical protein
MLERWPNRASLARAIRMEQRGGKQRRRPVVALGLGEGY